MSQHPILGEDIRKKEVHIKVDGVPYLAYEGSMIAAALLENGIRINRYTAHRHEPRGVFCGIGQCTDCVMIVNGVPNVRTCITRVQEGMDIYTQNRGVKAIET